MIVWTIGHGTRPAEELVSVAREAGVCTLVDVRRFPGSRHNPQFGQSALEPVLEEGGIAYRHAVELGGRLTDEPGEDRFGCLRLGLPSRCPMCGGSSWEAVGEPAPLALLDGKEEMRQMQTELQANVVEMRDGLIPSPTQPPVDSEEPTRWEQVVLGARVA